MNYQPKTGAPCSCKRGFQRDNCPNCEGTGMVIDFRAIRARAADTGPQRDVDGPHEYEDALGCRPGYGDARETERCANCGVLASAWNDNLDECVHALTAPVAREMERADAIRALDDLDAIGVADQVPGHVNYLSKRRMAELARESAARLRLALGEVSRG